MADRVPAAVSKTAAAVDKVVAVAGRLVDKVPPPRSTQAQREALLEGIYSDYAELHKQAEELQSRKRAIDYDLFQSNESEIHDLLFGEAETHESELGDWDTWEKVETVVKKYAYARPTYSATEKDELAALKERAFILERTVASQRTQLADHESTLASSEAELRGLLGLLRMKDQELRLLASKDRTRALQLRQLERECQALRASSQESAQPPQVFSDLKLLIEANKRLEKENVELREKLFVRYGVPAHDDSSVDYKALAFQGFGPGEDDGMRSPHASHSQLAVPAGGGSHSAVPDDADLEDDARRGLWLAAEVPISAAIVKSQKHLKTCRTLLEREVQHTMELLDVDAYASEDVPRRSGHALDESEHKLPNRANAEEERNRSALDFGNNMAAAQSDNLMESACDAVEGQQEEGHITARTASHTPPSASASVSPSLADSPRGASVHIHEGAEHSSGSSLSEHSAVDVVPLLAPLQATPHHEPSYPLPAGVAPSAVLSEAAHTPLTDASVNGSEGGHWIERERSKRASKDVSPLDEQHVSPTTQGEQCRDDLSPPPTSAMDFASGEKLRSSNASSSHTNVQPSGTASPSTSPMKRLPWGRDGCNSASAQGLRSPSTDHQSEGKGECDARLEGEAPSERDAVEGSTSRCTSTNRETRALSSNSGSHLCATEERTCEHRSHEAALLRSDIKDVRQCMFAMKDEIDSFLAVLAHLVGSGSLKLSSVQDSPARPNAHEHLVEQRAATDAVEKAVHEVAQTLMERFTEQRVQELLRAEFGILLGDDCAHSGVSDDAQWMAKRLAQSAMAEAKNVLLKDAMAALSSPAARDGRHNDGEVTPFNAPARGGNTAQASGTRAPPRVPAAPVYSPDLYGMGGPTAVQLLFPAPRPPKTSSLPWDRGAAVVNSVGKLPLYLEPKGPRNRPPYSQGAEHTDSASSPLDAAMDKHGKNVARLATDGRTPQPPETPWYVVDNSHGDSAELQRATNTGAGVSGRRRDGVRLMHVLQHNGRLQNPGDDPDPYLRPTVLQYQIQSATSRARAAMDIATANLFSSGVTDTINRHVVPLASAAYALSTGKQPLDAPLLRAIQQLREEEAKRQSWESRLLIQRVATSIRTRHMMKKAVFHGNAFLSYVGVLYERWCARLDLERAQLSSLRTAQLEADVRTIFHSHLEKPRELQPSTQRNTTPVGAGSLPPLLPTGRASAKNLRERRGRQALQNSSTHFQAVALPNDRAERSPGK